MPLRGDVENAVNELCWHDGAGWTITPNHVLGLTFWEIADQIKENRRRRNELADAIKQAKSEKG